MEIKFLGTGGAFDWQKGTSSAIIEHTGKKILIDCGSSVFERLCQKDLIADIDYVLITHLHGDHVGSLFQLIAYFNVKFKKPLPVFYPTDSFKAEIQKLLALQFKFDDSVDYVPLENITGAGYIDTKGQHVPDMPGFAYYFKDNEDLIYYSGDLGVVDTTLVFLKSRTEKNITVFHDVHRLVGLGGHVSYKEAQERLGDYEVYGYHCAKEDMPADCTVKLVEDYPDFLY